MHTCGAPLLQLSLCLCAYLSVRSSNINHPLFAADISPARNSCPRKRTRGRPRSSERFFFLCYLQSAARWGPGRCDAKHAGTRQTNCCPGNQCIENRRPTQPAARGVLCLPRQRSAQRGEGRTWACDVSMQSKYVCSQH
ncbi:hypothetical protein F5Y04DRAFT_245224 [Hypomontagnella monticulosa]|nr:hypothetical protein F5Y04DRAFT_245224 [Hypomontagnella monticulosa]